MAFRSKFFQRFVITQGNRPLLPFLQAFLCLALLAGLTGCTTADYAKLPPAPQDYAAIAPPAETLAPYKIQVGDVLDVKFRMNPELNETLTVRPDGMISTALVEDVAVYNKTVKDINVALRKLYSKELTNPKISVIVRSFAPTRVYVSGEVAQPGEFIVIGPSLTLTQAISRAGGTLNSSDDEHVLILRRGAGGKTQVYLTDYFGATQGGDPGKDVRLAPYDVVFVPKSGASLTHRAYEQYLQQYISPSVGATYQINGR